MITDFTKEHPDRTLWRFWIPMMFSKNYGSIGIWMAWPFGWIAATVLTLIFYRKVMRRQLSGMNK